MSTICNQLGACQSCTPACAGCDWLETAMRETPQELAAWNIMRHEAYAELNQRLSPSEQAYSHAPHRLEGGLSC